MNHLATLERILSSINEGIEHADQDGLSFTPEYELMLKQRRVMEKAIRKMRRIQIKIEEQIGGRRVERLTCENPDK